LIKRISLVRRREGMSREEFAHHWTTTHAELALRLPGLRGYRIDLVARWLDDEQPWDGFAQVWFESEEAMEEAFALLSDEFADDRPLFIGEAVRVLVEEHVVLREPAPPGSRG
jgi:uncharacterized protein (TIGR02118 family)